MMSEYEKTYWYYKELYMRLPAMMQYEIVRDRKQFIPSVKSYLNKLSKLEQLIYTNEIQGE